MVHSRDVIFDEASTPGVEKEVASTYVELEINEESTTRDSDDLPDREQLSEDFPVSDTSDKVRSTEISSTKAKTRLVQP